MVGKSGSSPRLRGTELTQGGVQLGFPVHPRACGEQNLRERALALSDGSSPRLRGTELLFNDNSSIARFIPAPAGNRTRSAQQGPQ